MAPFEAGVPTDLFSTALHARDRASLPRLDPPCSAATLWQDRSVGNGELLVYPTGRGGGTRRVTIKGSDPPSPWGCGGLSAMRIVVIDDHAQFAEVVGATMSGEPDFEAVGHATNVADGLDLIETMRPDLVALNVHIGPGDSLADIRQITARHPAVRVVVLAASANEPLMRRAAQADARALHPKDAGPARLLWILRNTGHEGFTVHPEVLNQLTNGGPLSPRRESPTSTPTPPPTANDYSPPPR